MASTADRLLGEALKLAPEERARIVAELLATLEPDLPSERRSEGEWIQEIERRARAAIAGSPGVSWAEARTRFRAGCPLSECCPPHSRGGRRAGRGSPVVPSSTSRAGVGAPRRGRARLASDRAF